MGVDAIKATVVAIVALLLVSTGCSGAVALPPTGEGPLVGEPMIPEATAPLAQITPSPLPTESLLPSADWAPRQYTPSELIFVSREDLKFQSQVGDLTGYDWSNLLTADHHESSKLAVLVMLANEIAPLENWFEFVDRSVGISKSELPGRLAPFDTSKKNLFALLENVRLVYEVFHSKGLPSQVNINRVSVLESYLSRYTLPEGELSPGATGLFADMLGVYLYDFEPLVPIFIQTYNFLYSE